MKETKYINMIRFVDVADPDAEDPIFEWGPYRWNLDPISIGHEILRHDGTLWIVERIVWAKPAEVHVYIASKE